MKFLTVVRHSLSAVILSALLVCGAGVRAATDEFRQLTIELDAAADAVRYEINVTDGKNREKVFTANNTHWKARLKPGHYSIRVRSVDERGEPGEWSANQELDVPYPKAKIIEPDFSKTPILQSQKSTDETIHLRWTGPADGANYHVQIKDAKGKTWLDTQTEKSALDVALSVANQYFIAIEYEKSKIQSEKTKGEFKITGTLPSPALNPIPSDNTHLITWQKLPDGTTVDLKLEKKDPLTGQFKTSYTIATQKAGFQLKNNLPSGTYKISLSAHREGFLPSTVTKEFSTRDFGNRSPAAITQMKQESAYRPKGIVFGNASYFVTFIHYNSTNYDHATQTTYDAIGGTGRLGLGTWFKEGSQVGMMLNADLSGFTIVDRTFTYLSSELLGVYKAGTYSWGSLRLEGGVQYKQLPETVGYPNLTFDQVSNVVVSPVINIVASRSLSKKFGVQINAKISDSLIGISTTTGASNVPQLSYQFGLLGSMNLNSHFVGFIGYAYRDENAAYRSKFDPTQINTLGVSGHYLNLLLEYGF